MGRGPAQGKEEEPVPDGAGESQEKQLPEQQPAGGGRAGEQGEEQPPPPSDAAGSNGNQQQPMADAPSGEHTALPVDDYRGAQAEYFVGVDASNRSSTNMRSISGSDDHTGTAYGGDETLDAQRAERHQQAASRGGAGSSPDEQPQPATEAPNGGGAAPAAATGAASQQADP